MAKKKTPVFDDDLANVPPAHADAMIAAALDDLGREINDPVPHFLEVTPGRLSMRDRIKQMLRQEISQIADNRGLETYEESQDFDVDDPWDEFPTSEHEILEEEFPVMSEEPPQVGAPPDEPVGDEPPASPAPPSDRPEHPQTE